MVFQLLNNVRMTLAGELSASSTELMVLDSDLPAASQYDPTKKLALTLVGDEELNQYEIVYAVERTGTTFEITRGEENTTAGEWSGGTPIVAALTADVLFGVTQSATSASNVTYEGGNFGGASTVEEALDDQGNAIIRLASDTDYFEAVQQRIGGGLFSGGTVVTNVLRWQGSAKQFITDGFGTALTTVATMSTPTVVPDMALCLRCADITNWGSVKIKIYNNASPGNSVEWTIAPTAIPANNAWLVAFLPATAGTFTGSPGTVLPDRVQVEFKDDATGLLTVDVNFVDAVPQRLSYLGPFIKVATNNDFNKVNAIAQYGFRVSLIVKDTAILTLDQALLRRAQVDGHRIYLTSDSNFKAQTLDQALTTLYTALRNAFKYYVKPDGWVYKNGYNGPFDADPTRTVRGAVATVYPRGVGMGTFRTAVEVYRFDDPLIIATSLGHAQGLLTGSDKTAINIDLTQLTLSELNTLMTGVIVSRNFYSTTLDYQNADNLKSGTVSIDRLPTDELLRFIAPIGTVLPFAGVALPAGWVFCDGRTLTNAMYPRLAGALGVTYGGTAGTNFRVPDLRGFVVAGRDNMGTGAAGRLTVIGTGLGNVGGEQVHYLTPAEMPYHAHGGNTGYISHNHAHYTSGATDAQGMHNHGVAQDGWPTPSEGGWALRSAGSTRHFVSSTDGNHAHNWGGWSGGVNTNHYHGIPAEGGGTWHNNSQLTMVLNWIIRAL